MVSIQLPRCNVAKLDKLDLQILEELKKEGRVSITELAKRVKSSRPTVTKHVERMREEAILNISAGLDLQSLGYKMALVSLEVSGDENRKKFHEVMGKCPRVQTIFRSSEIANIKVGVWGEDESTINSCVESFRDLANVKIVDTDYLGTPIRGNVTISVNLGDDEFAPCGKTCAHCSQYENEWCPGCPVTIHYKNPLLKSP